MATTDSSPQTTVTVVSAPPWATSLVQSLVATLLFTVFAHPFVRRSAIAWWGDSSGISKGVANSTAVWPALLLQSLAFLAGYLVVVFLWSQAEWEDTD